MKALITLLSISSVISLPLQQNSLITLRTVIGAPRTPGGNTPPPPQYGPLVLEEWNINGLVQSWSPPCSLVGLSTETWTEGYLSPRYPWGDQAWFLCRNVPVNSSFATNPAPVSYMVLTEDGILTKCVEDFVYPNGTNVLNILPYSDFSQGINVYYLLGGGTTANGPSNPARAAQPRIRVDSTICGPADTEGSLLAFPQGVNINQLRILTGTLYGTGVFQSSTGGTPSPTIFQIGAEGVLPTGTRNPTANIAGFPFILSSWTDPNSAKWWRTGFNRTAYVALYDNSDESDLVFLPPPTASAGTLGGSSWSVATARQEGQDLAVYLTNTSHIVKNTLNGLTNGLPYQPVVQAPSGWRYLSAHARNPNIPTPSATATATATSTSSPSASASSTATTTTSASASATATTTGSSTSTSSTTTSSTPSSSASATATTSRYPEVSPSNTASQTPTSSPSSTPSNGTIPVPNNAPTTNSALSPGETVGISMGSIAAVCVAGLLVMKFSPSLQRLYIRQFGSSSKTLKKTVSFRKPVTTDVPITISHNPQVLIQQRLEQLRELQKEKINKELKEATNPSQSTERFKKEFQPKQTV